jgi:hypothetical protein
MPPVHTVAPVLELNWPHAHDVQANAEVCPARPNVPAAHAAPLHEVFPTSA